MTFSKNSIMLALAATLGLQACAHSPVGDGASGTTPAVRAAMAAPVVVDLRLRDGEKSPYRAVSEIAVPASHTIGDGLFPYEGIGWENGFAGYRIYLDHRLVSDIFGKQQPAPALGTIVAGTKYHDLADWGMDVLHVGPSLGLGGIGVVRDGEPKQLGALTNLVARIDDSGGASGRFTTMASGIPAPDGTTETYTARYAMGSDSPMTRVAVSTSANLPLATGLILHPQGQFFQSAQTGNWRYIATWGDTQSENKDGLGTAVFYRADQARYGGFANETQFVTFDGSQFEYGFLGAWSRDALGIKSRSAFTAYLDRQLSALEASEAQ